MTTTDSAPCACYTGCDPANDPDVPHQHPDDPCPVHPTAPVADTAAYRHALTAAATAHVLSVPRPANKLDGRGFFVVDCSCGEYTSAPAYPASRAQKAAAEHKRAREAARR